MKFKEAESIEEIEQLSIALSDNCSRVSAKRRVVDNQEIEDNTWVIGDKDLTRVLSFG